MFVIEKCCVILVINVTAFLILIQVVLQEKCIVILINMIGHIYHIHANDRLHIGISLKKLEKKNMCDYLISWKCFFYEHYFVINK